MVEYFHPPGNSGHESWTRLVVYYLEDAPEPTSAVDCLCISSVTTLRPAGFGRRSERCRSEGPYIVRSKRMVGVTSEARNNPSAEVIEIMNQATEEEKIERTKKRQ